MKTLFKSNQIAGFSCCYAFFSLTALVLIMVLFTSTKAISQTNFYNDYLQQEAYYDSLIDIRGVDNMEGTGYTQYKRWFRYWAPKLLPDLDYDNYQQELLDYAQSYSPPETTGTNLPIWHLIGPDDTPLGNHGTGTGQIHYIYKDSHDLSGNTLFACSPVGGLFRTTNGGNNWQMAGTDKGISRSGVSSVVVDSHDDNTWYITTGNGESFKNKYLWQYSIGLYITTNSGESWEEIKLPYHTNMRKVIEIPSSENTSLLVTTTHGLFRVDNANTVSPSVDTLHNGEFYDVEMDLNDSTVAYASGSNTTGVFQINLINNSVVELLNPDTIIGVDTLEFPAERRISLELSPAQSNYIYAVSSLRDGNKSYLFRYNTLTQEWVSKGELHFDFNGYARKFGWTVRKQKHQNRLDIFGQDVSRLHVFSDSLTNYNTTEAECKDYEQVGVNPHADFHFLLLEDNDSILWAGTDGGVYKGEFVNDTTIYWESKNNGLGVSTVESIDVSPDGKSVTSGQFDCGSNIYTSSNEIDWNVLHFSGGDGYQTVIINDSDFYVSPQYIIYHFTSISDLHVLNPGYYNKIDTSCNSDTTLAHYSNWDTYYDVSDSVVYMAGSREIRKFENGDWSNLSSFSNSTDYPEMGCAKSGTWEILTTANAYNTMYCSTYGNNDINFHYYHIYKSHGGGVGAGKWELVANQPINGWISAFETKNSENTLYVAIHDSIFEVTVTNPSQASWKLIKYNLNVTSISDIERGNGRVWIGTDRGVWYLEDNETIWVNYTENLPNCEVKSLKIKNDKIYAGTYGRGVWYASAPGCFKAGTIHINESNNIITPNLTKTFTSDVVVPTGITYTIEGVLRMGVDCRIIVERGAKLIVDGGTVTNACPDMWWGIEVQGNPTKNQSSQYQGWVELDNALVENSQFGIYGYKMEGGAAFLDFAGGVIQATDSYFKNNVTDVQLFPYPEPYSNYIVDSSFFTGCNFITDSTFYFFRTKPNAHLYLFGTGRVLLQNNNFQNYCSLNFANEENRGKGIYSVDGSFYAVRGTGENDINTFNGLEYGIKTFRIFGANIKIDSCQFNHNQTGIYMGGNTYDAIDRNTFNIIPLDDDYQSKTNYSGVYLDNCTGYSVQENTFYSEFETTSMLNYTSWGIYINNSGSENNMLYKNNFHNLNYSTTAVNSNRSADGNTGLQIKCNNYWENYYDIAVNYEGGYPIQDEDGIAQYQGGTDAITAYPGNQFSHSGYYLYSDYDNHGNDIYYYLPNSNSTNQYSLKPEYYYSNNTIHYTSIFPPPSWSPEIGCPSSFDTKSSGQLKSLIASNNLISSEYADSLATLVDDGNTVALTLDVQTAYTDETMEVRQELLDASPYLSDTVLASAIEKEEVLPNAIITEVLVANPQTAKSEKLISNFDNRENPPSQNQKNLIMANDTVFSHKEKLEGNLAYHKAEKYWAANQLVRLYLDKYGNDAAIDSIDQALDYFDTPNAFYQKAFLRLAKKDSLGVLNRINAVPSDFDLSEKESDNHDYYADFFKVLLQIQSDTSKFNEITDNQKSVLYDIVNNATGNPLVYARNLLILADSLDYTESYLMPEGEEKGTMLNTDWAVSAAMEKETYINLSPNPAKNYLSIEYELNITFANSAIIVNNINGKSLLEIKVRDIAGLKIINLQDWATGIYIVSLKSNGKIIQSEKFTKY